MKIETRKPGTEIRTTVEFSEEQFIKALELYIEGQGYVLSSNIVRKCVYFPDKQSHEKAVTLVLYTQLKTELEILKAIEKIKG